MLEYVIQDEIKTVPMVECLFDQVEKDVTLPGYGI